MRDSHMVMTVLMVAVSSNCCCGDFSPISYMCIFMYPHDDWLIHPDIHIV